MLAPISIKLEDGPIWNPLVNNGAGKLPGMEWHSGGHTHSMVPFYAKGRGSRIFNSYADENDPVRGRYLDNVEMGKIIFKLLQ